MKQLLLTAFASLLFVLGTNAQSFQDTTFTDPVYISFPNDFVTFENCRFVGIEGTALTLEGAGALLSNCRFENINGGAIVAFASEVYLVSDTLANINGDGVYCNLSAISILSCQMSQISTSAAQFDQCVVTEVRDCAISDAGNGIWIFGDTEFEESYIVNTSFNRILNGDGISVVDVNQLTIDGVVLDSCMARGIYLENVGDSTATTETVTVQGNIISRINRDGIYANGVYNAVFRGNRVGFVGFMNGVPGAGEHCLYWKGINGKIEGNTLHHALDPGCGFGDCRSAGLWLASPATITRNKIYNCSGHGIFYQNEADAASAALQIFNNFIYEVGGNAIAYRGDGASSTEPVNAVFRNNTLHSSQSAPISVCCNANPVAAEGNILIYQGQADTTKYVSVSSGGTLLDQFNLKAPGDLGFVNFAGRDFHLASEASPAHNALPLNFGLPNDDFDGDLRLGLRDAGADELVLGEVICGCNNCPNEIPEFFYGDFNFSVLAADKNDLSNGTQGVCGVRVEFQHEYVGDLDMELRSPSGQSVRLVGPNGFWGSTSQTTWNVGFVRCDGFASPDPGFDQTWNSNQPWGETGTYTGLYYPSGGCLEDFNAGSVIGDWTLRVTDNQADDTGSVLGFEVMFCDMSGVSCFVCSEPPTAQFEAIPVGGWGVNFGNQSTAGVTQVVLNYGDGQVENGAFFQSYHEYDAPGAYLVKLIVTNDCGVDSFLQVVQIAGELPAAFVFAEPTEGCSPLTVQTNVISADHVESWHWIFPGGTPTESFEMEPSVIYALPGVYTANLILENEVGSITLDSIFNIEVAPGLVNPGFTAVLVGDSIICTNTTQNAVSFNWNINGGPSVGQNTSPFVFEVDSSGVYTVGLFAAGICDATSVLTQIIVLGSQNLEQEGWRFALSPNPNAGRFQLNIFATEGLPGQMTVVNGLGMQVYNQAVTLEKGENQLNMDLENLPAGVYQVHLQTEKGRAVLRFVVQ